MTVDQMYVGMSVITPFGVRGIVVELRTPWGVGLQMADGRFEAFPAASLKRERAL